MERRGGGRETGSNLTPSLYYTALKGLNGFIAQEQRERERGGKKAFTFPIQRQSLHTDGLPPVESRAGGRCILQKKNLPTRPFFFLLSLR